jgi:hypothetical protein
MLWWLVGLWVCSPVLLPVFWLLGKLGRAGSLVDVSPADDAQDLAPGD